MSGGVSAVTAPNRTAPVSGAGASAAPAGASSASILPAPSVAPAPAIHDSMGMLYALTTKQRDAQSQIHTNDVKRESQERDDAMKRQKDEIEAAQNAKKHGGWLSGITDALSSVADAVVGNGPIGDLAHDLTKATGCKAFDIAYDIVRPDALLHAATMLAGQIKGAKVAGEVVAAKPWEGVPQGTSTSMMGDGASLKERSQAVADASGKPEIMDAYAAGRDAVAGAMITVATCGTGTVAVVTIAASAALMAEQQADLLGKLGVSDKTKMWVRLGAQAVMVVTSFGTSIAGAGAGAAGSAAKTASGTAHAAAATAAAAAKTASTGVQVAKVAGNVINGASLIARGTVQIGNAAYQHAADLHLAEASRYEGAQDKSDRETKHIVDGLRHVSKQYEQTLSTLASTMNERAQTPLMLAQSIA